MQPSAGFDRPGRQMDECGRPQRRAIHHVVLVGRMRRRHMVRAGVTPGTKTAQTIPQIRESLMEASLLH